MLRHVSFTVYHYDYQIREESPSGNETRGEMKNAYTILFRRPERKMSLERPRSRWNDNTTVDLNAI
jgi:hypothetical protein